MIKKNIKKIVCVSALVLGSSLSFGSAFASTLRDIPSISCPTQFTISHFKIDSNKGCNLSALGYMCATKLYLQQTYMPSPVVTQMLVMTTDQSISAHQQAISSPSYLGSPSVKVIKDKNGNPFTECTYAGYGGVNKTHPFILISGTQFLKYFHKTNIEQSLIASI